MKNSAGKSIGTVKWLVFLLSISAGHSVAAWGAYTAGDFSSMPINIVEEGAKPRVMIASGKDHQLFLKAYND
jgi:hypothetical protein